MSGRIEPRRLASGAMSGCREPRHHGGLGHALADFIRWADDNGVIAPALTTYQWVRTNAPNKSYSNKSLAVMLKDDCIHVTNWTTGENFTFFDARATTGAQCRAQRDEQKRLARLAEQQRRAEQEKAALDATQLWHEGIDAPATGYFANKCLTSNHGARWHERLECWLILMADVDGKIQSVQKIFNDGGKLYLKAGRTAGGMFVIGSLIGVDAVLITEGFATGCTLRETTGKTVAVAFSAGNLMAVCTAIRNKYPAIEIVVCADDDRLTVGNPGRTKADEAATAVSASVAYPPLCAECSCTDFNDAATCKWVFP